MENEPSDYVIGPDDMEEGNQTIVFGTASFLNDASSDMIAPIWPTFLYSYLGLSYILVGFIDGLALTLTSLSTA